MSRNNKYGRRTSHSRSRQERIYKTKKDITLIGRFLSTSVGGVFFELDGEDLKDDKYFIDASATKGALNGDTV